MLHYTLDGIMPVHRALFSRFDVTEQQWRILRVLWDSTSTSANDISKLTLLSPPSLVGILDRLEKKDLIAKVRSVKDKRTVYIVATAKGRELQVKAQPCIERIQEFLKSTVSDAEWTLLELTLSKISQAMNGVDLEDILEPAMNNNKRK